MDLIGCIPVLSLGSLYGQTLPLHYLPSLQNNSGGEETETNYPPQVAEAAVKEHVNLGNSEPSSLIGSMPPVATIRYYSSSSSPLPSFRDFDRITWVEWLRQLANPSPIEEALLWFLDTEATIKGVPTMASYAPQFTHSSGIGKLPNEILVMILDYSVDQNVSRLILQLVNKHWHDSMQAPNLWNNMTLELTKDGQFIYASNRLVYLRRCLQRSGSVALDVTIRIDQPDFTWDDGSETVQIPFELILRRCSTKNWGSLVVALRSLCSSTAVSGGLDRLKVDHVCLPSLKSLTVQANKFGVFKFNARHTARPETPAHLHKDALLEQMLDCRGLAHLTSLRTFSACAEAISTLSAYLNLQELHLTSKPSDHIPMSGPIQFPPIVTIHITSTMALQHLHLKRIQHLTIEELTPNLLLHEISIPLPELQVLVLEKSDFRSLIYISAPKLQELYIGSRYIYNEVRSADAANMVILFRDLPQYIKVAPKILRSRLPMTTEATMLLLEMWPQLEHASIRLIGTFEWQWLVEGLIKRKKVRGVMLEMPWKYCPHLQWLKLVVDGPVERRGEWENHAKAILRGRQDSLLTCISWKFGSSPDCSLNREDLGVESG